MLFLVIGGVSASDVADVSNNPDNNNLVSDSSDSVSEESIGNYYANQLSNEEVSSLDGESVSCSTSGLIVEDESNGVSNTELGSTATQTVSSASDAKSGTALSISDTTLYSGTPFYITLKDKNGKVLKDKKVVFNNTAINKLYTKTTNSKGQVRFVISSVGTYKAIFSFAGDNDYNASKLVVSKLNIVKSSTSLEVVNTTVPKSTDLIVVLKNNKSGNVLANKKVSFKIPASKKTYTAVTDSKGQAKLQINSNSKKIDMVISFAGGSDYNKTSIKTTVFPINCSTKLVPSVKVKFGRNLLVGLNKALDNKGISGRKLLVKVSDLNISCVKTTNSNGRVWIPVNALGTFEVKVRFAGDDSFVGAYLRSNFTIVKGPTYITSPKEVEKGDCYTITLKNSMGKALANKKVVIKFNNKTYTKTTNSKGQVSLDINLKKGSYPIKISFAGNKYYNPYNVSKTVKVVGPRISISKIITAAKDLKTRAEYINLLNKSYTVYIDNKKYTLDEFAYLMAGAITNINDGSKANVKIKDLSNNYKSSGAKINGKLSKKEYLKLAENLTKYVDSNNRIPNNSPTNIGKMEADLYIYAFTSILDSYSKNKKLPSSVNVKTNNVRGGYSYSLSQGGKILNCREIFDSDDFKKYLQTGGKSALNDAIKKKAKSLTKGLDSPLAKAIAIFRYVRDDVTYSFYSNSLKGATGTFKSKSGNCCDKANLIVAMCRSVGVHARYSHAQGCKFQSGLYTGHVWAQVYDTHTQTWYSADATSFRNEVGNIKNWNTKSHYRDANYVLIPF